MILSFQGKDHKLVAGFKKSFNPFLARKNRINVARFHKDHASIPSEVRLNKL